MSLYIPVGQIVSVHGIKGEVRFKYYNEVYEQFFKYTSLYYESEGQKLGLKIKRARIKDQTIIIKFEGVNDRDGAEKLRGKVLYVKREDLPKLEEDEYYFFQIIGLEAKNEHGKSLGKVKEIMSTGPHQVLVIEGEKEVLVPFVQDFVMSISLEEKVMTLKEPEYI
jgi:16S rRNA processing protein RimM